MGMSMNRFADTVRRAVEALPDEIKRHLDNVVIDVDEEPDVQFLRDAGFTDEEIAAGDTLYGYFMPMDGVSAAEMLENPSRILIFRNPLVDDFPDPRELAIEIRKTVVHEISHHFGLTDRDLESFDDNPNPFGDD